MTVTTAENRRLNNTKIKIKKTHDIHYKREQISYANIKHLSM